MKRNDPRIEQYFNFELSPEEEAEFLSEAKESPEVWEHIQFMQWMVEGIKEEGKDELRTFIANRIAEEKEESSGKFWYAAAAVVVTLVVSTIIAWPYLQTSKMSEMATTNNQVAADSTIALNDEEDVISDNLESSNSATDSAVILYDVPLADEKGETDNNGIEYKDESAPADVNIAADDNLKAVPESEDKIAKPLPAQVGRVEIQKLSSEVIVTSKIKSKTTAKIPENFTGLGNSKLKLDGQIMTTYSVAVIEKHGASAFLSQADSINYNNDPYRNQYPLKIKLVLLRGIKSNPKNNRPSYQIIWNAVTQQTELYLQDFGDQSTLVYRLDSRNMYLEIQGIFYALNLKEGIQEPKKIMDPAIIKALQD